MFVGVEALGAFEGQTELVAGRPVRDSRRCCGRGLSRAARQGTTLCLHTNRCQPRRLVESWLRRTVIFVVLTSFT
jgi:hypothetical protein